MAILHSGAGKYRQINEDDYRAYLITRNQEPIVYHSPVMQFKRLQVRIRGALNRIDHLLHWMSEIVIKSKQRGLQRGLMMRGIYRNHKVPHNRDDGIARNDRQRPST